FNKGGSIAPFHNTGIMINGHVYSIKLKSDYRGEYKTLGDILQPDKDVPDHFYIDEKTYKKWNYLKGAKKELRVSSNGYKYAYSEGGMVFPDDISKPSRTIITGEGGPSPSRFKHVVKTKKGLRRLTPIELERLNGFPDNHTKLEGVTANKRAFFMGNALVVGVIEKIAHQLEASIDKKIIKRKKIPQNT
ncbi:MAG: DNA cytosine methyltransferase, partial [Flavobacteriales bacterium]